MSKKQTQKELIDSFFNKLDQVYENRLTTIEKQVQNNESTLVQIKNQLKVLNNTLGSLVQLKQPLNENPIIYKNNDFKSFFDKIIQNSKISRQIEIKNSLLHHSNENIPKTDKNQGLSKNMKKGTDFKILQKKGNIKEKLARNPLNKEKSLDKTQKREKSFENLGKNEKSMEKNYKKTEKSNKSPVFLKKTQKLQSKNSMNSNSEPSTETTVFRIDHKFEPEEEKIRTNLPQQLKYTDFKSPDEEEIL